MIDQRAVSRYANALFQFAKAKKELEKIDKYFLEIRNLVSRHPEISHLLLNSTISRTEKEDFLDKIVPSKISRTLLHFLKVLIKKRRFQELLPIQEEFHRLFEKSQGVQEVTAISTTPLSASNERKLCSVLKKKLRSEIRLIPKTDPKLIGGLILRFDGTEINASFRDRLHEIRQKLMS